MLVAVNLVRERPENFTDCG